MGKLLSKDDILSAKDIKTERVAVPEWGGSVLVKGLTGEERDAFEETIIQTRGKSQKVNMKNARAKLVVRSVVNEKGNHIFADEDVNALGKKSAAALEKVFEVAQRLSGLTKEDVEELAKNSETDQSESSGLN